MANYECSVRTNYFHVKNEERFREFFSRIIAEDLELWEEKDENEQPVFGFGGYGYIYGLPADEDDEEGDWDAFINGLVNLVADNDAVIIMESGHEKLRYVTGVCHIITSKECQSVDMISCAIEIAKKLLNNNEYSTKTDY